MDLGVGTTPFSRSFTPPPSGPKLTDLHHRFKSSTSRRACEARQGHHSIHLSGQFSCNHSDRRGSADSNHARVEERVGQSKGNGAKCQIWKKFALNLRFRLKSKAWISTLLKDFTPSTTLAWKVDGCVPQTQDVNFRIARQPD